MKTDEEGEREFLLGICEVALTLDKKRVATGGVHRVPKKGMARKTRMVLLANTFPMRCSTCVTCAGPAASGTGQEAVQVLLHGDGVLVKHRGRTPGRCSAGILTVWSRLSKVTWSESVYEAFVSCLQNGGMSVL